MQGKLRKEEEDIEGLSKSKEEKRCLIRSEREKKLASLRKRGWRGSPLAGRKGNSTNQNKESAHASPSTN